MPEVGRVWFIGMAMHGPGNATRWIGSLAGEIVDSVRFGKLGLRLGAFASEAVSEATAAERGDVRSGNVAAGRPLVASYTDKARGSLGVRSEVRSHDAAPGKQTLVEQLAAPVVQRRAADKPAPSDETTVRAAASRGVATPASPLPFSDTIQRAFGRHDVSSIQAHTGREAATSAQAMGADAYATGDHVVLQRGADLNTVAHEAAHVVQQRGGVQLKGGVGAARDVYERHADAVADRVVAGQSAEDLLDQGAVSGGPGATQAVQRKEGNDDTAMLENQASLKGTDVEIPRSKARCWPPGRKRSSWGSSRRPRSTPAWHCHRR